MSEVCLEFGGKMIETKAAENNAAVYLWRGN